MKKRTNLYILSALLMSFLAACTAGTQTTVQSGTSVGVITQSQAQQPVAKPKLSTTRIAVISDLNGPYGSLDYDWHVDSTIAQIVRLKPDIVIAAGDLIAGQDVRLPDDRFPQMWEVFDKRVALPLREAGIPFGFTVGNHDGSPSPNFSRERVATRAYWEKPEHHPGLEIVDYGDFPFYYSYRSGDVFFISWDASSANITESTLSWVEEQLQSDLARSAVYRVVLGHLPLYAAAVGRNRPGEILRDSDNLLEVMKKYDVDMYVSGHHHAYYPGYRGGVDLLQTGALGGGPRPLLQFGHPPRKTWTMLEVSSDGNRTIVDFETFDADTNELVNNNEIPRYLHGITGFTVRTDLEIPSKFRSVWLPDAGVSGDVVTVLNRETHTESALYTEYLLSDADVFGELFASKNDTSIELKAQIPVRISELNHNLTNISDNLSWQLFVKIDTEQGLLNREVLSGSLYGVSDSGEFHINLPLTDLDSDALRGGVYYFRLLKSKYSEKTIKPENGETSARDKSVTDSNSINYAESSDNGTQTEFISLVSARLISADNLPPGSVDADRIDYIIDGQELTISWPMVLDPDGDAVFYETLLTPADGVGKAYFSTTGPSASASFVMDNPRQVWNIVIRANDGAKFGVPTQFELDLTSD